MNTVRGRTTSSLLRLGYVAVLCSATLVPFGFDPEAAAVSDRLSRALSPYVGTRDLVDGARNLALFAGWGLLWVLTARSSGRGRLLLGAALTGTALSVSLEGLQLLSSLRRASVLDVLTNGTGAAAGAASALALVGVVRARAGRRSYVGAPALVFLLGYGSAVLLEATFPTLRQDLLPVWGGPLNRLSGALRAFDPASVTVLPWLEGLLFLPAGAMAVTALAEAGWEHRRAALVTAVAGAAAVVLAEVAHGLVSHPIEIGPVLVHAAGLALGAAAAARWLGPSSRRFRGRERPLLLATAYGALLLLWTSRPFDLSLDPALLSDQLRLRRFVPLSAHGVRGDLYSVADVCKLFVLYLPLGALLSVWPLRTKGALGHVLPALYLAAGAELLQVLVGSRFFDMTDLLVAAAGATVGWAVLRRVGFTAHGELLPRCPRSG